jgi:low temperature requirement protein LtrA
LLIMAVSTVLQIETYGAKKILVRLITVALLINFSLLFARIPVDFSQVLTSYFITAAGGTAGTSTLRGNASAGGA